MIGPLWRDPISMPNARSIHSQASWQLLRRWHAQASVWNVVTGVLITALMIWLLRGTHAGTEPVVIGTLGVLAGAIVGVLGIIIGGQNQPAQSFGLLVLGCGMARMLIAAGVLFIAAATTDLPRRPLGLGVGTGLLIMLVTETFLTVAVLNRFGGTATTSPETHGPHTPGLGAEPSSL